MNWNATTRKAFAGASLAGLLALGTGAYARSVNFQEPSKQEQQSTKSISGKVANIGNGGHSFSLQISGQEKGTMQFQVDKNTQVNGQVREGSTVTVEYRADDNGQNVALSITAQA